MALLRSSMKHKRTIEVLPENPNALAQSFDELNLFADSKPQQAHQHPTAFAKRLMQVSLKLTAVKLPCI